MSEHEHHENLIDGIAKQFSQILDTSGQGIYIYLDDTHKVCNEKFAKLLGYDSPKEWAEITESFPQTFVAEKSQNTLVSAYQDAMEKCVGSQNTISWKKKDGSILDTKVILVPVSFDNHLFALHFVS